MAEGFASSKTMSRQHASSEESMWGVRAADTAWKWKSLCFKNFAVVQKLLSTMMSVVRIF
jgi:hypothetical protein